MNIMIIEVEVTNNKKKGDGPQLSKFKFKFDSEVANDKAYYQYLVVKW